MDPEPQAPPVVAVVVCHDPGPWFEEAVAAVAAQDYPNLSVLVIDAASHDDPTPRVASVAPDAFVRRLTSNAGFAASADEVLEVVEGASHFLFCHDDVAPEPDALRLLVEEAYRSNAGIVTPKLVDWDNPERLLQVGMAVDKSGAPSPLVERGELDQEQHDSVRDVFVAPGGCTLVRADLFVALGGFDRGMSMFGEDLDLSWRAQVAGARVIVAPAARVRHLEATASGRRGAAPGERVDLLELRRQVRPVQLRHRLRAVLSDYGTFHLIRVLPQLMLLAVVEMVFGVLTGHADTSRDILRAWRWNLDRLGEVRARRRALRPIRQLHDGEVRRLQARGSARVNAFFRGQLATERRLRVRGVPGFGTGEASFDGFRLPIAVTVVIGFVLFFGSRHLIGGRLAAVGELAPFPHSALNGFIRPFLSGWRPTGLGAEAPAPAAFGLLGIGSMILFGSTALLQQVLVLGAIPVGAIGALRLAKPFGSQRVRMLAPVAYLAVPVPYNALARGHWSGLLVYAAAPFVLRRLLTAAAVEPFATGLPARPLARQALPLGLLLALLGAFVPSAPFVFVAAAVGLLVGGALTREGGALVRAVGAVVVATGIAAALLFPWSLDFVLPGARLTALTAPARATARALGFGAILRFQTGPVAAGVVGWALLVAAALPLAIGRGWRFAWAARLWTMALTLWLLTWAGSRGWLHIPMPAPEVLLAPAALAMALCVALGLAAFETDLPGYSLGWRQAASAVAAVAVVAAATPVVIAAFGGRWHQPARDFDGLLSWMPEHRAEGEFRVLWIGDPDALPLGSWQASPGVAYATSRDGPPDITDRWPDAAAGSSGLLADAVGVARRQRTTQLGHLLAPLAVRYLVVPHAAAPAREHPPAAPAPADLTAALEAQLDLKQVESDDNLSVYENVAWMPGRALLDAAGDAASRTTDVRSLQRTDLSTAKPALGRRASATGGSGRVPDSTTVILSEASSSRWKLRVAGHGAVRREAFGWANAWDVDQGGPASLRYDTSPMRAGALLIELVLWAVVGRAAMAERRRRRALEGDGR